MPALDLGAPLAALLDESQAGDEARMVRFGADMRSTVSSSTAA